MALSTQMPSNKCKPLYFQIAPPGSNGEEVQRLCEAIGNEMGKYVAPNGLAFYRGFSWQLDDGLRGFIERNKSYPGPLVIAINTHGAEKTGYFEDLNADRSKLQWTPDLLWNGIFSQEHGTWIFSGLKKVLPEFPGDIYIVFAQCYGGLFGKEFCKYLPSQSKIHIVGLSDGPTVSQITNSSTIGEAVKHLHLLKWMELQFKDAKESSVPAKSGPGSGALVGLAANSLDDWLKQYFK